MTHRPRLVLTLALALTAAGPKAAKPAKQPDPPRKPPGPPSEAVLKHVRAATALVVVDGKTSAAAFCVNPAGLFVTHRRVVDAAKLTTGGTLALVVDPGTAAARRVSAKVIRLNAAVALLQTDDDDHGPAPYHTLPLTDANGPGRDTLWAVVAAGFNSTAVDKPAAVPAPATPAMWCWARYKPAGHWHSVHLETAVPPGATGGPVVGYDGKVVGVLDNPGPAGQISVAAPADDVYLLAETPVVSLRLSPPAADGKRTFTAAVLTALGKLKDPAVTLQLGTGPTAVTVPMTQVQPGAFTAAAAPPPTPDGKPLRTRVTVTDGHTPVAQADGHLDAPQTP